jgi:cation diffusion facilitator CzcD-associated flavoprotein CzcO
VTEKHGLAKYMKFCHTVLGCSWDKHEGVWNVRVRDPDGKEFTDTCHVLVNGGGILK